MTNLVYGGTLSLTNLTGMLTGGIYAFHLFSAANYSGSFSNLVPSAPPAFSALRWDTYELNVDGVLRIFPAVSTPPVVSGTSFDGGNNIISAGSGIAYDPCWLLTCTNLAAPNWSITTTNYFDVNGNTTFTNAVFHCRTRPVFQTPGQLTRVPSPLRLGRHRQITILSSSIVL